jgi:hypothetical protein
MRDDRACSTLAHDEPCRRGAVLPMTQPCSTGTHRTPTVSGDEMAAIRELRLPQSILDERVGALRGFAAGPERLNIRKPKYLPTETFFRMCRKLASPTTHERRCSRTSAWATTRRKSSAEAPRAADGGARIAGSRQRCTTSDGALGRHCSARGSGSTACMHGSAVGNLLNNGALGSSGFHAAH